MAQVVLFFDRGTASLWCPFNNQGTGEGHELLNTRALKEAERGEVKCHFEKVGFGRSFVNDAEAVELHAAAGISSD